jgi:hypothetical protein
MDSAQKKAVAQIRLQPQSSVGLPSTMWRVNGNVGEAVR